MDSKIIDTTNNNDNVTYLFYGANLYIYCMYIQNYEFQNIFSPKVSQIAVSNFDCIKLWTSCEEMWSIVPVILFHCCLLVCSAVIAAMDCYSTLYLVLWWFVQLDAFFQMQGALLCCYRKLHCWNWWRSDIFCFWCDWTHWKDRWQLAERTVWRKYWHLSTEFCPDWKRSSTIRHATGTPSFPRSEGR